MIAFAGGYCNFFPVPAHDKKAELLYALPIRMHVYDEVEDTLKIIREAADCPSSFPLKKCVLDSDDIQQYQNNWEVQLWLGKQGLAGVNTSLAKDKRLRCPSCVLTNNPIRLLDTSMKVGRQPDLPVLLENTLPRRASVLGYKWDSHHKDYSMIKSRKGLTGSFRDRQKKRKRKQS